MSEDPAHLHALSLHLSRALEEVGLNVFTVTKRRHTFLFRELFLRIYSKLTEHTFDVYHFGSQTEGATTQGLVSDIDTLYCNMGFHVIENLREWMPGKFTLLMLQDDTAPGYCRLQLLSSYIPMGVRELPYKHYTYDSSGRVILKNTECHTDADQSRIPNVRHGPARSHSAKHGYKHGYIMESDIVFALNYCSWPEQAEEFLRRQRHHGWPSQQLLQEVVQHGVFLVPVGYKLSPTEELEWRLSASLAERCLIFSLSTVHIKCYVVLKMLMKTFVEPHVSECISSYHCKTALMYCTENTDPGFWRDDSLLQCVIQCLIMLLAWVTDGFCPQFIICKENLFAGKVTPQNRGILMSILTGLIESKGRAIFQVKVDDLGLKLQAKKENTVLFVKPVVKSVENLELVIQLEFYKQLCIESFPYLYYVCKQKKATLVSNLYRDIEMLKNQFAPSNRIEQQALTLWTQFLSSWLGFLLASVALSQKRGVPSHALQLLRVGANYDCATTLKLASVLYRNGDVQRAEKYFLN